MVLVFTRRPLCTHPQAPSPNLPSISMSLTGFMAQNQLLLQKNRFRTHFKFELHYIGTLKHFNVNIINQQIQKVMKDRWKILIVSIIIALVLGIIFLFLGFSFRIVTLREYGLLQYSFFQTVDRSQTVRSNGNYLVGIDYDFVTYPKGLLSHKFTVQILTKDKSIVNIQGLYVGQLISSQIINLHFAYGPNDYFAIVTKTVEEIFRESMEQFLLTEIISQRQRINSYVSSNVCLNVESKYSFMNCQYVSTGQLKVNAVPVVLPPDISVQTYFKKVLDSTINSQKKMNVYGNGGFNLIDNVETLNAQLFLNTTNLIVSTVTTYTLEGPEVFAGATYVLDNPLMPVLNNQIYAFKGDK